MRLLRWSWFGTLLVSGLLMLSACGSAGPTKKEAPTAPPTAIPIAAAMPFETPVTAPIRETLPSAKVEAFGWRGDGTGVFPNAHPPTEWDDTRNILWKADVGKSHASPAIGKGCVFVTAEPADLVCVDTANGHVRWKTTFDAAHVPAEFAPQLKEASEASTSCGYATPTPVCDGERVFAVFGFGIVACYSVSGDRKWIQFLKPDAVQYGHSGSPALVDGKLIVNFGRRIALNFETGKVLWECPEAEPTYGTDVVVTLGATRVLVTSVGTVIRVNDGHVLAKAIAPELGGSEYGISPTAAGDVVYLGDREFSAVKLALDGNELRVQKLWTADMDMQSFASPVVANGLVFFVGIRAEIVVLDQKTGEKVFENTLSIGHPGMNDPVLSSANLYPSLSVADNHVFVGNDYGQTFVYEATRMFKELAQNRVTEGSGATPVPFESRMYLRSGEALYCIEKK